MLADLAATRVRRLRRDREPLLRLEDLDAVLARELRGVERDVGPALEIRRVASVIGERRHPRRGRRQRAASARLTERLPHPIGHLGSRRGRPFDDERELLAPDAEDLVLGANDAHENAADRAQHLVAREVPFAIVDLLEVVEVEDDEGDPRRLVARLAQHLRQVLVEGALVREARERVAPGLGVRQREPALVGERLGGEVGHARDELRVGEGLDARRKRDEHRSQGLRVGDQRRRDRLGAGRAEPVELPQLMRVRLDEPQLRVRARDDVRRRVQRFRRARPGESGQRRASPRARRGRSPRTMRP